MEDPSHSIERIWTRLARGSLFMPRMIVNFMLSVKHKFRSDIDSHASGRMLE